MKKALSLFLALALLFCCSSALSFADEASPDLSGWTDVVQLAVDDRCILGLRADGSVLRWGGEKYGLDQVDSWTDMQRLLFVSPNWEEHYVFGLKKDGTVISTSEADLSDWHDIVKIVTSKGYWVAGLKKDGTVIVTKKGELNEFDSWGDGWLDVSDWRGVVDLIPTEGWTAINGLVGLFSDGTVRFIENTDDPNNDKPYNEYINSWSDIIQVCSTLDGPFGLRADGTLAMPPWAEEPDAYEAVTLPPTQWRDVVFLCSGFQDDIFAVTADGRVECATAGMELPVPYAQKITEWRDVEALCSRYSVLLGLRTDGTVLWAGDRRLEALSTWSGVKELMVEQVGASCWIFGLRLDGSVLFLGLPDYY